MDFHVSFKVSMVIAVVFGELISALWYSHAHPWGRKLGDRYLVTALLCDVGLVIVLQYIIDRHWSVSQWEQAVILSLWLTLFFTCLQAPHHVHDSHSLSYCVVHVAHKFTLVFVMILALVYFRHY